MGLLKHWALDEDEDYTACGLPVDREPTYLSMELEDEDPSCPICLALWAALMPRTA